MILEEETLTLGNMGSHAAEASYHHVPGVCQLEVPDMYLSQIRLMNDVKSSNRKWKEELL